ncbi:MAG: hypothetical protein PHO26_06535 [Dehalococcoidia bacterium]|nr:hypothetical protein [Dehalococcoidia bacterium]MDD5493413.1 hypothetical protein [Dehalococcoidia bacterium]
MTGLETAIILIAFVTVAAVFGYAILSAGLFSAERDKETLYAGLSEAKSNVEISGSVIARSEDNTNVRWLVFTLKNAVAGNPIDLTPCNGSDNATNNCVISLITSGSNISNAKWTKQDVGATDGDNLLETGEQFEITIDVTDLGDGNSLSDNLTANDIFTIQVNPSIGASAAIQRTLPPQIDRYMDLH